MAEKFGDLTDRVGWLHHPSGGGRIGAARLKVSNEAITLDVPLDDATSAALGVTSSCSVEESTSPKRLVFVDRHGRVGLDGCRLGRSTSRFGGTGEIPPWTEVHADTAVEIERLSHEFWTFTGVRAEIAGVAGWSALSSLSETTERDHDGLLTSVTAHAQSPDPIRIGTEFNVALHPHFSVTGSRANGTYTLTQRVYVQTEGTEPMPLEWHIEALQGMQDLLAIAYGQQCGVRIEMGCSRSYPMRELRTGRVIGDKWRPITSTWNGRGTADTPLALPHPAWPLFTLEDLGTDGVRRWIAERDDWTRVTGPVAASLFQARLGAELQVMQVAVSLEALGYRIALRQGLIERGGSLWFPKYLRLVADSIGSDLSPVLQGSPSNGVPAFEDFDEWAAAFNEVYKQAKHADHPMPEPLRASVLAQSAELLVRVWLSQEFGVSVRTIEANVR